MDYIGSKEKAAHEERARCVATLLDSEEHGPGSHSGAERYSVRAYDIDQRRHTSLQSGSVGGKSLSDESKNRSRSMVWAGKKRPTRTWQQPTAQTMLAQLCTDPRIWH